MNGIIFLSLSVASSVTIVLIMRVQERRRSERLVLLASNYIVAAGMNLGLWLFSGTQPVALPAIGQAVLTGIIFVMGFLLLMKAIGRIGVGISVAIMRMAILVPIIVSVLVYAEHPAPRQITGIILAFAAFILFSWISNNSSSAHQVSRRTLILLPLALFLCMGFNETSMKIFSEHFPARQMPGFLAVLFGTAAVFSWLCVVWRRSSLRRVDIQAGLILGIPNSLSCIFFIQALHHLDGIVAFPVNGVAIVVVSTVVAIVLWREIPSRPGWLALILACAAIVLMNLKL